MVKENYRCKENYWGLVVRQSGARPVIFCVSKKLSEKLRTMNRALVYIDSCYIKPAERADLQISLGKTRHISPNCVFTLEDRTFMTSHVAAKEHVTPWPVWSAYNTQFLIEFGKKDLKKCLRNLGEKILKKCSQTYARLQGSSILPFVLEPCSLA